ncbi:MAG: CDP-glucose 4,6-dehydratase [Phycisphaeraceae bacterium]|nr:CDP-glucose 4,6-dehydratase [Phycisphaeraceae bacterium]
MANPSPEFWRGTRTLVTGHTGFKGAWLLAWLRDLGAVVRGVALPPHTTPSAFDLLSLADSCEHVVCDIRQSDALKAAVREFRPRVVVHMAAQALVRAGYRAPAETFATNVMGTVNVLEACRDLPGLGAVVVVTSDKCYENREWVYAYREIEALGGHDPYSASKGAAEIVAHSYRRAFFGQGQPALATARAGNVVGGGDWSDDRLIADAARAAANARPLVVRHPDALRPWQHVLEPLRGYLLLAQSLCQRPGALSPAFNFGPQPGEALPVRDVADAFCAAWGRGASWRHEPAPGSLHEANLLTLDPSLAARELAWRPAWTTRHAISAAARWYQTAHTSPGELADLTRRQIADYQADVQGR